MVSSTEMDAWVTRVLQVAVGGQPGGTAPEVPVGLVAFAKLRLQWNAAQAAVAGDIARLRDMVLSEVGDDPLSASVGRLGEILSHFREDLADRLDELANADTQSSRAAGAAAAAALAQDHWDYVMDDPLIDLVETNPFMDIVISGRLMPPLGEIRAALATVQAPAAMAT